MPFTSFFSASIGYLREQLTLSVLVGFFVGGFAGYMLEHGIDKFFLFFEAKPRLSINLTEIQPLADHGNHKNFKLLFATAKGTATIALAQTGNEKLNKRFGLSVIPFQLIAQENQVEYSLNIKNTGNKVAKNIVIDLVSISELAVLEEDPRIVTKCGELFTNQGCHIEIKQMQPEETLALGLRSNGQGIREVKATIDGEFNRTETNFMNYAVSPFNEEMGFDMNGERVVTPKINSGDQLQMYVYSPSEKKWNEVPLENRTVPIRRTTVPKFGS